MQQRSFVIIGNGIAGATAAEALRTENSADTITVVTDDPCPVFYRPALKDYLAGKVREEKLWARPISFYPDRQVRFLTGKVVGLEPKEHVIHLQSGQRISYTRLLLAQGARATALRCTGANLAGVATLRTVADYQRVLAHLNYVRNVVVIGSGTLALESIETLRHRGYQVTHLLRKRTLWSEVLDATASDLVLQQEQRDGVDVRMEQEVGEVVGEQGRVTGVVTKSGMHIPCELVLVGIGIEPETDFVAAAGIACGRGVKIDTAMRTNVADIYAAGDLVETQDPITGKSRVIGQWYPAIQQARAAAYSMLDVMDRQYTFNFGNFYNACMLYGIDFASVGISVRPKEGADYVELCADPRPQHYQKVILKRGVPVGMIALGDRRSVLAYKRAIDHQVNLSPVSMRLFAPAFQLEDWLNQQGVPSAIFGVNREEARALQQATTTVTREKTQEKTLPAALVMPGMQEATLVPVSPAELVASIGQVYLSQMQVTTIGRQEGAKLHIQHPSVSRRHAEISYLNRQYILRDLGSSNGTVLNNQRVQPSSITLLKTDDRLQFGDVMFTLRIQSVEAASSFLLRSKRRSTGNSGQPSALASAQTVQMTTMPAALPQQQLELTEEGALLLPGLASPLTPATVADLRKAPALVAIMQGQARITSLVPGKRVFIGRQPDCELAYADMSISRRHAEVFFLAGAFSIRDLESSNGVFINHQRITSAYRLAHGERITLGSLEIYFIDYSADTQSVSRPPATPGANGVQPQTRPATICRLCGAALAGAARFCPVCGAVQQ